MRTNSSLLGVVKSVLLAWVVFTLSAGLNIMIIMFLWSDRSVEVNLWILQSILPSIIYRIILRYSKETEMTPFKLFLAVVTPLMSLVCMDLYRVYAYYENFGRTFGALKGFVPHVWQAPRDIWELFAGDFYNSWWTGSLYVVAVIFSIIIHYPAEVQAFFEHLRKKFAMRK